MNWTEQVADCIEDEGKRIYLKDIPIVLLSATEYQPDTIYWLEWMRLNCN